MVTAGHRWWSNRTSRIRHGSDCRRSVMGPQPRHSKRSRGVLRCDRPPWCQKLINRKQMEKRERLEKRHHKFSPQNLTKNCSTKCPIPYELVSRKLCKKTNKKTGRNLLKIWTKFTRTPPLHNTLHWKWRRKKNADHDGTHRIQRNFFFQRYFFFLYSRLLFSGLLFFFFFCYFVYPQATAKKLRSDEKFFSKFSRDPSSKLSNSWSLVFRWISVCCCDEAFDGRIEVKKNNGISHDSCVHFSF